MHNLISQTADLLAQVEVNMDGLINSTLSLNTAIADEPNQPDAALEWLPRASAAQTLNLTPEADTNMDWLLHSTLSLNAAIGKEPNQPDAALEWLPRASAAQTLNLTPEAVMLICLHVNLNNVKEISAWEIMITVAMIDLESIQ